MSAGYNGHVRTVAELRGVPVSAREKAITEAYAALDPVTRAYVDEAICELVRYVKSTSPKARFSERQALELLGTIAIRDAVHREQPRNTGERDFWKD